MFKDGVKVGQIRSNMARYETSMKLRQSIFELIKTKGKKGITMARISDVIGCSLGTAEKHCVALREEGYIDKHKAAGSRASNQFAIRLGEYQYSLSHFESLIDELEFGLVEKSSVSDSFTIREGSVIKVNEHTTIYGARNIRVPLKKSQPHIGSGCCSMLALA